MNIHELEERRDKLLEYIDKRESILMQTYDVCSADEQMNGLFGLKWLLDELSRLDSQIYELQCKVE